jgi:hypothetical protein
VPTIIAQQLFAPKVVEQEEEEALGTEDATTVCRRRSRPKPEPGQE